MRKFVKVELGSRGEVDNVELLLSSYELIEKEFNEELEGLKDEEDEEGLEYLEEFGNIEIDKEKGEVGYGFSEEDYTFYVEVEKNKDLCEGLLKCWEEEDLDVEFYELIGSLGC
jgi:rubrerythrin